MANLNTCLMMLTVYMRLNFKLKEFFVSKWRWTLVWTVIIISLVLGFLPLQSYKKCVVGGYEAFCGACFDEVNDWQQNIMWVIFLLPASLGIILIFMVWVAGHKLKKVCQLSEDSILVLRLQFMPLVNIVLICVNAVISLLIANGAIVQDDVNSAWNHVLVFLDQIIHLSGFFNWLYFVLFARKGMLFSFRIKRLRWLFFLRNDAEDDWKERLSEDDWDSQVARKNSMHSDM